jgi:hypothetical protein
LAGIVSAIKLRTIESAIWVNATVGDARGTATGTRVAVAGP